MGGSQAKASTAAHMFILGNVCMMLTMCVS